MSHAFSHNVGAVDAKHWVSLAPVGSAQIFKAGRVKMTVMPAINGATAANGYQVYVRLYSLEAAPAGPAPTLDMPAAGDEDDVISLSTTAGGTQTFELGQPHQKGWNPDAQGTKFYTHAAVQCKASDNADRCIVRFEVD